MMDAVRVEVPVRATEDPEKVREAVMNVFPDLEIEGDEGFLKGEGNIESLSELREALERRRIRLTARGILLKNMRGKSTRIYINKQAALINRINVLEEPITALGDIMVEIESDDLMGIIDWLAPDVSGEMDESVG
ncbi:RNA-binding domain-containing protein [Methanothermobacter sp. THM-2]|uniref:RNA-binding domain-containing protein n=1 Tax=Methanothermobacter sp. THM-2 TaxID=2606912 RepID=UPI001F5BB999|nr:RNA-binding domain-containing protein [Methanothermobacter sp. THM-2]